MTKEEMKLYAEKYRRTQKKLSVGVSIFIFLISLVLLTIAVLCIISLFTKMDTFILFISIVLAVLAIVDIIIGIRFIGFSRTKFDKMKDKEAAEHYCKIHGFSTKIEE